VWKKHYFCHVNNKNSIDMKKIKTMTMIGKRILMYLMLCVCFISASGTNVSIDGPHAKPKAFYERMLEAFCSAIMNCLRISGVRGSM